MNNLSAKFIPVALLGLVTSSLLGGSTPYMLTSTQGGPIQDELDGNVSFAQADLSEALSFETVVEDISFSNRGSQWLTDSGEDMFPKGSPMAVVRFKVTNISSTNLDLFGLHIKAWYEGSENLASSVLPVSEAPHAKLGYPEYLVDRFPANVDEWILQPGQSLVFAESFYTEGDKLLNITVSTPNPVGQKKAVTSETFSLAI
jgi:hypothetical protein